MAQPARALHSDPVETERTQGLLEDLSLVSEYCKELCSTFPDDLGASSVFSHLLRDICEAIDDCLQSASSPPAELISRSLFGLSAATQIYFDASRSYREQGEDGVERATMYAYRAASAGELAARLIQSEWIVSSRMPSEDSPS